MSGRTCALLGPFRTSARTMLRQAALVPALVLLSACGGGGNSAPEGTPSSGSIAFSLQGLPSGTPADIVVTGPNGYSKHLNGSCVLAGLSAGTYTFTASDILTEGQTYHPWQPFQTVACNGTGNVSITVLYPAQSFGVLIPDVTQPGQFVPMAFVLIPAGGFSMGSSGSGGNPPYSAPVHNVSFGKAFYMAKYECTQAQWKAIMGTNPSHFQTSPQQPVESLFWSDIATSGTGYLDKLNTALSGYQFRLPSEAEWEYAARAGSSMAFHFGDETTQLPTFAWTTANASGTTHPVGQKQPNAWGLYDMHGNVWEWTADDWHDNYTGAPTNGSAWVDSPRAASRVFRGGSFNDEGTPVAVRYGYDDRNFASGFRLVVPVPK